MSSRFANESRIDHAVLDVLLHEPARGPWAVEELVREIGDPVAVQDSLERLRGSGLVHRLGESFVFATRAAVRADQILV